VRLPRVVLSSRARAEARDAFAWYAGQSPQASERFQAELRAAIRAVQEAPERWALWRTPYRRLAFDRFPYSLVYRRVGPDEVLVVAVRHQQRDPDAELIE
jgi:plasmid stabilization system protein ParE